MDVRVPTHGAPPHPGEMLLEEYLRPMGVSQSELARRIGVTFQTVNSLVHGRSGLSTEMALKLSRFFGNSVGQWLNFQRVWDLYHAQEELAEELEAIQPVEVGG